MKTYTKAERCTTEPQREQIRNHYALIELVHNNRYLPSGNDQTVQELNRLHKDIYGQEVNMACGPCVQTLFDDLYISRDVLFETVETLAESK